MTGTAFFEAEFFVLLVSSFIAPFCINACVIWKQAISYKVSRLLGDAPLTSKIPAVPYLLSPVFSEIGVTLASYGRIKPQADAAEKFERI